MCFSPPRREVIVNVEIDASKLHHTCVADETPEDRRPTHLRGPLCVDPLDEVRALKSGGGSREGRAAGSLI